MKTKLTALALAIITSFSLTACQATPEEDFVVKKDLDRMIEHSQGNTDESEKAKGTEQSGQQINVMDSLNVPEGNYTFFTTEADGRLVINADAKINVPDVDAIPIFRVVATGISQDFATKAFNYLFSDVNDRPYNAFSESITTKSELEAQLIDLKEQQANGTYDSESYTAEEWQSLIDDIAEKLQTAPDIDKANPTVADGTMRRVYTGKISYDQLVCMDMDTLNRQLRITSNNDISHDADFNNGRNADQTQEVETALSYVRDSGWPYSGMAELTLTDGALPDDIADQLAVTIDEARAVCDDFLDAVGVERTYEPGYVTLVKTSDGRYAVKHYYRQLVNGNPTYTCTQNHFGMQDPVAPPWVYEIVSFVVDDKGVAAIEWKEPIQITDAVNPNARMLQFEDIRKIFERMIVNTLEPKIHTSDDPLERNCQISSVNLELVRIREQNTMNKEGLLVPAWVFYGRLTDKVSYGNEQVYSYDGIGGVSVSYIGPPAVMMVINAIDGSVIDLTRGY